MYLNVAARTAPYNAVCPTNWAKTVSVFLNSENHVPCCVVEVKRQSCRFYAIYGIAFTKQALHEADRYVMEEFEQGAYVYFDHNIIVHDDMQVRAALPAAGKGRRVQEGGGDGGASQWDMAFKMVWMPGSPLTPPLGPHWAPPPGPPLPPPLGPVTSVPPPRGLGLPSHKPASRVHCSPVSRFILHPSPRHVRPPRLDHRATVWWHVVRGGVRPAPRRNAGPASRPEVAPGRPATPTPQHRLARAAGPRVPGLRKPSLPPPLVCDRPFSPLSSALLAGELQS
jgi:hypothetical protein